MAVSGPTLHGARGTLLFWARASADNRGVKSKHALHLTRCGTGAVVFPELPLDSLLEVTGLRALLPGVMFPLV